MIDVLDEVRSLLKKAAASNKADDALKFSQAACNVAHARGAFIASLRDGLTLKSEMTKMDVKRPIAEAIQERRCELDAKQKEEYEKIDKEDWG